MERAPYAALAGRIQVRMHRKPVLERERFAARVQHAFKEVRYQHTLLADSGMELLRLAAQGLPRHAGRLLRLAVPKGLNPLPNELLQQAIEALR